MAIDYNRQYVGARYVPKFFENPNGSWDWVEGFQYEPMTIVQYGNNTYTSKKLVPSTIGSPNMNPDYWANTGNYNGAINNLQSQINVIDGQLISPNMFNGKNILLITDSYGTVVNNQTPYTSFLNTLISQLGGNLTIIAQGGAGLTQSGNLNFNTILSEVTDLSSFEYIFIQGFANDYTASYQSLLNNLINIRNTWITKAPKSYLCLLGLSKHFNNNNYAFYNYLNLSLQTSGLRYSLSPMKFLMFSNMFYLNDPLHITTQTAQEIAPKVLSAMLGNHNVISYNIGDSHMQWFVLGDITKWMVDINFYVNEILANESYIDGTYVSLEFPENNMIRAVDTYSAQGLTILSNETVLCLLRVLNGKFQMAIYKTGEIPHSTSQLPKFNLEVILPTENLI